MAHVAAGQAFPLLDVTPMGRLLGLLASDDRIVRDHGLRRIPETILVGCWLFESRGLEPQCCSGAAANMEEIAPESRSHSIGLPGFRASSLSH